VALRPRETPLWVDCVIGLLLFLGSGLWGTVYWKRAVAAGQPFYYQHYFEPAVMIACGKGFVVARPQVPSMVPFLWRQADRFSCDTIPSGASLGTEDLYQGPWRYLMYAVGVTWRFRGVSWSALGPLFGTMFAATIVAAYAVFRLGMSSLLAVSGALALNLSSQHLMYMPSLRDYSKAPFTLMLVFLLGLLVSRRITWRGTLTIAAAYGAILGLGYGFRTDFLADVPPFFLVLVAFLDGGPFRNLRLKAAAGALCAAMFLVVGWPVIASVSRSGGCQWHTALLGFARDYSRPLNIVDAPYEVSREYSDEFAYVSVTSYAARVQPGVGHIEYCQPTYDRATGRYLTEIVRRFPADIVVRAYASILGIVELPFGAPPVADRPEDEPAAAERGHQIGLALVVAAIGLASAASTRAGLALLFFVLYFAGYPAIQFNPRNYFHFEILTWWAAGFVLQSAILDISRRIREEGWASIRSRTRRAAVTLAGSFAALMVVLWAARAYQQVTVRSLLRRYVAAPKEEIPLQDALSTTSQRVLRAAPHTDPETADFLEVDLNGSRCGERATVTFRYGDDLATRKAFARTFVAERREDARELTRIFMPVYDLFQGIDFSDTRPGCVDGVYRLRNVGQPLMLEVVLAPGWQKAPLYQRIKGTWLGG
jgi:hypothetical protein